MTLYNENIDNKLLPIAQRYSQAILDVAKDRNELDEICEDLHNVAELWVNPSMADFRQFLSHPVVSAVEKKDLTKSVFEGRVKESTLNLLCILAEKNRLNLIPAIFHSYEDSLDLAKNILKVRVVSAVEMDEESVAKLKEKLEKKLRQTVKFEFHVDPNILAGLVLKIRCMTYDGSMATKLHRFKKVLGNY